MAKPSPLTHPPGVPLRTPVHPGRFLARHYLQPLALTQSAAARLLGSALTGAGGDLLERLELFDEFRGDAIGEGNKSLAWSVVLRAPDHTLSDDEVTAARAALVDAAESLGAALRS